MFKEWVARPNVIMKEPFNNGFDRLKAAPLENSDVRIFPYQDARITTELLIADEIMPTSYYALSSRLDFQIEFRQKLLEDGIDLFNLQDIFYFQENGITRGLIPPIVEVYEEPEIGRRVRALTDGLHRMSLSREMRIPQRCIVIENINRDERCLPYAIPNSWEEVGVYDEVPPVKKNYRRIPPYSYMKPLTSIFDPSLRVIWSDYGRVKH